MSNVDATTSGEVPLMGTVAQRILNMQLGFTNGSENIEDQMEHMRQAMDEKARITGNEYFGSKKPTGKDKLADNGQKPILPEDVRPEVEPLDEAKQRESISRLLNGDDISHEVNGPETIEAVTIQLFDELNPILHVDIPQKIRRAVALIRTMRAQRPEDRPGKLLPIYFVSSPACKEIADRIARVARPCSQHSRG